MPCLNIVQLCCTAAAMAQAAMQRFGKRGQPCIAPAWLYYCVLMHSNSQLNQAALGRRRQLAIRVLLCLTVSQWVMIADSTVPSS